ncbi:TonB-dependent receptor [Variovorax sp. J2P1-59]|uniref:TonB-dependent receptor n=1 Tax=Variovorax flavidus TaxID=3053501 RepID=UPI002577F88C|nr:TonB-dependent receptor [Variovorax sp. J2P1-59]MDM0074887.1 TonB-dependent receptor [Variovorax sp. J2P1-59]
MAYIKSRKHSPARYLPSRAAAGATATIVALGASMTVHAQSTLSEVRVEAASDFKVDQSASPKITAPLLDTPKSITVIPQEVIRQTGATTLVDALRTTPGITFGAGEGGNPVGDRPFIRGFDSQSDIFVDGVRDAAAQTREIFNVESVEVLKGPSSAFGGRGSAGGAVNIITKAPQAQNFFSGTVGLGTDSYKRGTIDLNRVLSEGVAARLNMVGFETDIADRGPVNQKRWGVAPSVTFGLDSPTKLTLSYYHYQSDDLPDSGIPYNNPFTTGPNLARNGDGQPVSVPRGTYYGLVDRDYQKTQADSGTIDFSHDFGNSMVLRNVTRYSTSSNDYIWTQPDDSRGNFLLNGTVWRRPNNRISDTDAWVNQTSLTGKLEAAGFKHSYAGGVEFGNEKTSKSNYLFQSRIGAPYETYPRSTITGANCSVGAGAASNYNCTTLLNPNPYDPWSYVITQSPAMTNVKTDTKSVYAFDTMEINDKWSVNLGLRWDDYSTTAVTPAYRAPIVTSATIPNNSATGSTTISVPVGGLVPPLELRNKSNFLNYQAGLVYKPAPNGSIYVSYGTSSTPPGTDAGDGADGITAAIRNLEPQDSRSGEIGTKWEVLDRKLVLTSAIFQTKMNNARVVAQDGSTQNVGRKEVKGIEFGAAGAITREWQVFGGYTYLDSTLKDNGFVSGAPSPFNGNVFPNTPRNSATLWTTYLIMPGLTIGGGATYVGKQYGNVNNTKWIPSYIKYDAMVSYVVNKNFSLQLNLNNLTDKYYFDKAYASHYATVAPGRSATLTGSFSF